MKTALSSFASFAVLMFCVSTALAQQTSRVKETRTEATAVAIKGGKLLTVTHGTIENGVVVIENGKITAVGPAASTNIPTNARVIDATGMTVYPGLIDSKPTLASPKFPPCRPPTTWSS